MIMMTPSTTTIGATMAETLTLEDVSLLSRTEGVVAFLVVATI